MGMVLPRDGLWELLSYVLHASITYQLRLYKNDLDPDRFTTLAELTEADFPGYAASTGWVWPPLTKLGDGSVVAIAPGATFSRSSTGTSQDVYGYFILDQFSQLIAVERFSDAPFPFEFMGDRRTVVPVLNGSSFYPD